MEGCTSEWTTDKSVCRPLQVLLNSIDEDEDTSALLSPRLRLMLIVIGVVQCQTPNMLALASLWETARRRPSPRQRTKALESSCNWGNIAGIQSHLDTSKCVCSQSGWCEEGVKNVSFNVLSTSLALFRGLLHFNAMSYRITPNFASLHYSHKISL